MATDGLPGNSTLPGLWKGDGAHVSLTRSRWQFLSTPGHRMSGM